jgi:hypothetical protein
MPNLKTQLNFANILTILLFLSILSFAYTLRENYIYKTATSFSGNNQPLSAPFLMCDSNAFYNYGLLIPYPCFTISRPPGFIILTRTILKCFGDMNATTVEHLRTLKNKLNKDAFTLEVKKVILNHTLLRESGILLNITSIFLIFLFVWWFAGKFSALICALLLSINSYSIFYSIMYLRVDVMTILNLSILILFIILLKTDKYKHLTTAGIIFFCSMASITRLSALSTVFLTVILFILIKIIYKKWNIKDFRIGFVVIVVTLSTVSPYLIYNYTQTSDFTPVMNHHAKFWRNHEFAGKPGYPTISKVAENPYSGPETTSFKYMFEDHTLVKAIIQYAKGYWKSFTKYLPKMFIFQINNIEYNFEWLLFFIFPGMYYCIRNRETGLMLLIFSLIVLFPFSFILSLNEIFSSDPAKNIIGVEPRFNMAILPYAFILCAIGIAQTVSLSNECLKKLFKS